MTGENRASSSESGKPQIDKIRDLAREIEADEDEARWDERLKKVAAHKPAPEPEKD